MYDPLVDLLHTAEQSCEAMGQPSKVVALQNLQVVLREDAELSKELQRRMARQLKEMAKSTMTRWKGIRTLANFNCTISVQLLPRVLPQSPQN
jgi:hypothetical protein